MKPLLFHFPDDAKLAAALAARLDAESGVLEWHRFPDGESLITLHSDCAQREVILVCGWRDPDAKALPFYFAATTARELGARRVGLVAPYLAYMRQDTRFNPGEARSAAAFARLLSASIDWMVTVDPHLHRFVSLDEVFGIPATAVSSMPAVAEWIAAHVPDPVLIGPDSESTQWAERIATHLGVPWVVLTKERRGDTDVCVSPPDAAQLSGRTPVIVDDIASSGHTLAATLEALRALGARAATCVIVHALFARGAEATVRAAGAGTIVSTNTVAHPTNRIEVAPLIAAAVRQHLA